MWDELSNSSLLEGFGRPPAVITAAAKQAAPREVPRSTFADKGEAACSIDDKDFSSIHASRPTWPAMSPHEVRLSSMRWACAVSHGGDFSLVSSSWLSLLLEPGCITLKANSDQGYLVLYVSPHGFLGLKTLVARHEGKFYLRWASRCESLQFDSIQDWVEWRRMVVQVEPPNRDKWGNAAHSQGMRVVPSGKALGLLDFALMHGFRNLRVVHLRKLFGLLGVAHEGGQKPAAESQLLQAIARHLKGDMTDADIQTMMLNRCADVAEEDLATDSPLFSGKEMELFCGEDEDEDEAREELQKVKDIRARRQAAAQKTAAEIGLAPPVAARPVAARELQPIAWVVGRGLTQPEAKRYAPPHSAVHKDLRRHMRWQIRASYLVPLVSKTFSEGGGENAALLFCLQTAWAKYSLVHHTPCPWRLDDSLF